ncbi:hypothetical protein CRUP_031323 [Coryphaenoides rupestris]|nr:hypothetical protein CRUP_031323 [Coryphaenoides rupestris]
MDGVRIREYRSEDYHVVRELNLTTCTSTCSPGPGVLLTLLAVPPVTFNLSGSVPVCLASGALVLLGARLAVRRLLDQGIRLGLREDLQDIDASYMSPGRVACFWVAEAEEEGGVGGAGGRVVVGTVGVLPCVTQPGAWELKRISVRQGFRGRGVARALCTTALGFAARGGVQRHLVLYTSMLQADAQRLYLRLGFRKLEEFLWPSLPARLVGFTGKK